MVSVVFTFKSLSLKKMRINKNWSSERLVKMMPFLTLLLFCCKTQPSQHIPGLSLLAEVLPAVVKRADQLGCAFSKATGPTGLLLPRVDLVADTLGRNAECWWNAKSLGSFVLTLVLLLS